MTPHGGEGETVAERRAQAVRSLRCADLVDALGRLHRHRAHILDLVTPTPGRILFGPAATISSFPSCAASMNPEVYNFDALVRQAVGAEVDHAAGKVLVLASNGYRSDSVGGGTKLSLLAQYNPVVVAGVGVLPGQYVFADDSGAVVIPEPDIDTVLAGAAAVRKEDAAFRAQEGVT